YCRRHSIRRRLFLPRPVCRRWLASAGRHPKNLECCRLALDGNCPCSGLCEHLSRADRDAKNNFGFVNPSRFSLAICIWPPAPPPSFLLLTEPAERAAFLLPWRGFCAGFVRSGIARQCRRENALAG